MNTKVLLDKKLIARYDHSGPRYTSYPTARQFSTAFDDNDYVEWVRDSNEDPIPAALSLYLHIPFCDTICYYCGCSKIVTRDQSKAEHYLELLATEIDLQANLFSQDREVRQIHWGGGTPTFLQDDQIQAIMSRLENRFSISADCETGIEVDPRTVTNERIATLKSTGFNRISFGVQDLDTAVQDAVNRVHDEQTIRELVETARRQHFRSINIDLMYGLPRQTRRSFEHTLQGIIDIAPDRLALYNYAHLPEMFKPQRRIDAQELPDAQTKLAILQLAIDTLQDAGYVYIGMDHFAREDDDLVIARRNGSLHRNFQGYSTHANSDLVAMGITAISRIGDNYSQNVRSLEDYEKRLRQQRLPVYRGYEMEPDDVLRHEIINQLMCHGHLDIEAVEQRWGIRFPTYFRQALPRLHEMRDDGLLTLNGKALDITPAGRLLTRSICMLFDRYLTAEDQPQPYSRII